MQNNNSIQDNVSTSQEQSQILAEAFLEQHFMFRRNVLSGMVEYRCNEEPDEKFRPVTQEALNSIILLSKRELGEDTDIKTDIKTFVESEEPTLYNPVENYLRNLKPWDGSDRVVDFCKRIPGITADQVYFFSIILRSIVANWLGKSKEHGNECVPLLIGAQGCGKSTFVLRILPPELRRYYLDHFNLNNKFDKELAMSGRLLVNLDEIDQYKKGHMAELKQALSKVNVDGRKIYGKTIDARRRFASFFATTNNRHPLMDPTGSRRFLCLEVEKNQLVDNLTPINYDQLYAQILNEIEEQGKRYWFTNEETVRLQALNARYEKEVDLETMLCTLFTKPEPDEDKTSITTKEIQRYLQTEYPTANETNYSTVKIGKALKNMDISKLHTRNGVCYYVHMKKSA